MNIFNLLLESNIEKYQRDSNDKITLEYNKKFKVKDYEINNIEIFNDLRLDISKRKNKEIYPSIYYSKKKNEQLLLYSAIGDTNNLKKLLGKKLICDINNLPKVKMLFTF